MPEEIGIALVVLIVAGWGVIKIFEALAAETRNARVGWSRIFKKRAQERFENKKRGLAQHVRIMLPNELEEAERDLASLTATFRECRSAALWEPVRPTWTRKSFESCDFVPQSASWEPMNITELESILTPDVTSWHEIEFSILQKICSYPYPPPKLSLPQPFSELQVSPLCLKEAVFDVDQMFITEQQASRFFESERILVAQYNERRSSILSRFEGLAAQIAAWNVKNRKKWERFVASATKIADEELAEFTSHADEYTHSCTAHKEKIEGAALGFGQGKSQEVIERVGYVLGSLKLPNSVPRMWEIDFDQDQQILIVEVSLPDVIHRPPMKTVRLKSGPVDKPLNQTEKREFIPKVHPAILLRLAYEVFRNDGSEIIKLLVLNGWVQYLDPSTGIEGRVYTASLMVERSQIISLNLGKVDPLAAFIRLLGKSAGKLVEIVPIEPSLNLKKNDSRFVDAKAVLNTLGSAANIAAMDWQDFEHLIRELFEKEFTGRGAEVKITRASRDRGVDAVVFNPDPIHGGKYVIQAKRYTNTVDVSAVRDLCAVVRKEGASRGILVTTSTYGADAYEFANNEPVTLLNGAELLGLLKKHGYNFRINLEEARKLNVQTPQAENTAQRRDLIQ